MKRHLQTLSETQMYGSTIHLVRINTPMNFKPDMVVKKRMEDFARQLKLKNYTLNVFNDFSEEEGIIHFLRVSTPILLPWLPTAAQVLHI